MSPRRGDQIDPKNLIHDAYEIEGITLAECRSVFMDWALSIDVADPRPLIEALIARHGEVWPDHPMSQVLQDGLGAAPPAGRRGGRRRRLGEP